MKKFRIFLENSWGDLKTDSYFYRIETLNKHPSNKIFLFNIRKFPTEKFVMPKSNYHFNSGILTFLVAKTVKSTENRSKFFINWYLPCVWNVQNRWNSVWTPKATSLILLKYNKVTVNITWCELTQDRQFEYKLFLTRCYLSSDKQQYYLFTIQYVRSPEKSKIFCFPLRTEIVLNSALNSQVHFFKSKMRRNATYFFVLLPPQDKFINGSSKHQKQLSTKSRIRK